MGFLTFCGLSADTALMSRLRWQKRIQQDTACSQAVASNAPRFTALFCSPLPKPLHLVLTLALERSWCWAASLWLTTSSGACVSGYCAPQGAPLLPKTPSRPGMFPGQPAPPVPPAPRAANLLPAPPGAPPPQAPGAPQAVPSLPARVSLCEPGPLLEPPSPV